MEKSNYPTNLKSLRGSETRKNDSTGISKPIPMSPGMAHDQDTRPPQYRDKP